MNISMHVDVSTNCLIRKQIEMDIWWFVAVHEVQWQGIINKASENEKKAVLFN